VSARSHLDPVRFGECIYYLRTYGSSRELVRFWTFHGLVEKACRACLGGGGGGGSDDEAFALGGEEGLGPEVWVEDVALQSVNLGQLGLLLR